VFPGQGSQAPGMGATWVDDPAWAVVDEASEAAGRDVAALLLDADADALKMTRNSQLSTYVLSMVVLRAATAAGLTPAIVAGHSLGEYSALTAAGVLTVADGVRLVTERGEAMQACADARPGTMAAVLGLDGPVVAEACAAAAGEVWVANDNAPGQVVIAGSPEGVEAGGEEAKARGAKRVMGLPVGGAFHTPFMAPASERLAAALAATPVAVPSIPIVSNVDAAAHTGDDEWRAILAAQLTSPVRWTESVGTLVAAGVNRFVELGPGAVLTGTIKRIAPDTTFASAATPEQLAAQA
jgi:[acyl-carrier-protein] S-malonyltransferase